jgi:uncharacterized protein
MKLLALGLALILQGGQDAPIPPLTGRVVDAAGILSSAEESDLTRRLERIENETSVQIVIATIPSLQGEPIEDFSLRLAEAWKIGQANLDNGVIVVVVPDERRVRIEVGYGLEAVIPDGLAGRIIRERMAPAFREGDYYGGLVSAVEGLELAARKEYPESPRGPAAVEPAVNLGALLMTYFFLGILGNAIGILLAVLGGAILFPFLGGGIAAALGWWAAPMGGLLGLFAVLLLRGSGRRGGWTWHDPGRRGGWSGGGGFGGGGFGGGGFSGGGGGFGGGGASGRW